MPRLTGDVSVNLVIARTDIVAYGPRQNLSSGFQTMADTNRAVQPQEMARSLTCRIKEVEGLYYLWRRTAGGHRSALLQRSKCFSHIFMPPTLKKWGTYWFRLDVRMCVCRDIVLKLHVWIPHGKIADAYFLFSLNYLPLLNYGPLTNKGMKFC